MGSGVGLVGVVLWALGLLILYWIIRLAVKHGVRDAEWERHRRS